ncbi:hypothetical protein [Clostridium ljungdahlii]|uniref:Phage-related protein n=1 Tax=Clostridium ljungdahlii (strain ATCC 55383 / DSM 13528 / PETC) TaxID=748727 RepID=D8GU73_CLOLD|nr:hypothetical protein [Clostridium ljungdahlii]ADK14736.1 phage-related protein [Clostridium ljungdahlii DSM 13528]OAA84092.1 hypothetical protein WX45_01936 [Clostridium ljungdahlii DSM 13528]
MTLIIPQVYSQIVREKFLGKIRVALLATPIGDLPEFAQQGDTIHFPKWKIIGDATEVVKGTQSAIETLDQDDSTAKIKFIDKIVRCYDYDSVTEIGNQLEEASSQQAVVFARALDTDLCTEASTTDLKTATASATAITAAELDTALANYGDDADVDDMAGIVVNSRIDSSFYSMDEFVDVNKTFTQTGNGIVRNGMIGYFRGIPVFHSNHGTFDSTTNECKSFIIKKDALGYKEKKAINIVEEREEKLHCSDIVGSYMYAVKMLTDGIIMLKKTIA